LRVLDTARGSSGNARAQRDMRERADVTEPLLCIASDSAAGVELACELTAALRTAQCQVRVLACSPVATHGGAVERRMRDAGASEVTCLAGVSLRDRALAELSACPQGTIAIALGVELAAQLSGLLTLALERGGLDSSFVDVELGAEPLGVGKRIGEWLGRRLGQAQRASYQ
jgi:hypothetical protein